MNKQLAKIIPILILFGVISTVSSKFTKIVGISEENNDKIKLETNLKYLEEKPKVEKIFHYVEENVKYGPITEESYKEIKQTFNQLKELITSNTETIYSINNFLQSPIIKATGHHDSILCKGCLWTFNTIQSTLLKKYGWTIFFDFIKLLCSIGLDHNVCGKYVSAFGEILVENLIDHYLNGEYVCTFTRMCNTDHFIKLTGDDYAKEILKDKPLNMTRQIVDKSAKTWKVLQITDIHVDMNYKEGSRGMCPEQLCCREEVNKLQNATQDELSGKWGFLGKCDIPVRTLHNFCDKAFNDIKPDFVIWTGDNPAHDAYDDSAFEVAQTFADLVKYKYNFTLPVYPALGNHEKFPSDEYNPYGDEVEFLTKYGDLWRDWIGEEAYQTVLLFGAYTKLHPNSNLRIVAVNCMMCDVINFNLIKNPTDPQSQIEWLEKLMSKAENDGEKIYLISHIPPGDSANLSECAKRYKALIDRYSHLVMGQFYGHTHYDEIKISTEYFDKDKVSGVSFIAPSLTTYSFLNPSFRVYEVDSNTKIVKDYLQYRFNITKANSLADEEIPEWDLVYRASEFFKVDNLYDYEGLQRFTKSIETDPETFNKIINSFFNGGPLVNEYINVNKMSKYLSCRFNLDVFEDYTNCIGYFTWDPEEYAYKILNFINGSWFLKLPD